MYVHEWEKKWQNPDAPAEPTNDQQKQEDNEIQQSVAQCDVDQKEETVQIDTRPKNDRRIMKEYLDLRHTPLDGIEIFVDESMTRWHIFIDGPKYTPFQQGKFEIVINFGDLYPFKPPKIICETKMFHPNVNPSTSEFVVR